MAEIPTNWLISLGTGSTVGLVWAAKHFLGKSKNTDGNGSKRIAIIEKDIEFINNSIASIEKTLERIEENFNKQSEWMRGHFAKIYDNLGENREKVAKIEGKIEK